ncbi:MAG: hypothetical protein ACM32E_21060 [Gemmatimonadota bacterium]
MRASKKAAWAGVSLRVAVTSPTVRKALNLLRLGQILDVYPGLEAAALHDVTPARARPGTSAATACGSPDT